MRLKKANEWKEERKNSTDMTERERSCKEKRDKKRQSKNEWDDK